jgi:hypothetical protein
MKGIAEKEIVTPEGTVHKTQIVEILDRTKDGYIIEMDGMVIHRVPIHCIRKLDPKIT